MAIKTLKSKIALFMFATILFFGVVAVLWVASYTNKTLVAQKKDEIAIGLASMSDRIKGMMDDEQHFVESIAHSNAVIFALENPVDIANNDAVNSFLNGLKIKGEYTVIMLLNSSGDVLSATDENFLGNNFGYRSYFKQAMENDFAAEVVVGAVTGQPNLVFAHRILGRDGQILGATLTAVNTDVAIKLLAGETEVGSDHSDNMYRHMLVDENGVVIVSDDPMLIFRSLGPLNYQTLQNINTDKRYGNKDIQPLQYGDLLDAMRNDAGISVFDYLDDEDEAKELIGIAPVHTYPFHVAMEFRETALLSQISKIYYALGSVILVACLAIALMVYFLLSKFLLPLKQLKHAAQKISENDFNYALSIKSGDELEEVGVAFSEMGQSLLRSKKEVEEKVAQQTRFIRAKQVELEKQQKASLNILEDVAKEKENSEKLAIDLEKFKLAIENANDQIAITDENGTIIYANSAMTRITGYDTAEAIGQTPALWGRKMNKQYYVALWKTIKEKKLEYDGELLNARKDGTKFLAHLHISPILDKNKEVRFFVGVMRDISKEREVQIQLKKDAEELKKANELVGSQKERAEGILGFLKSIGDGVVATDLNGKIVFFNEAAEKLTGVSVKEALGKDAPEVLVVYKEKDKHEQYFITRNALEGKYDFNKSNDHFLIKRNDGVLMAVSFSASLIYDAHKKKQGCIVVIRDVTQQREIEKTKDDFLSVAAHQLRTPLTGIRWSLEMLLDGDLGKLSKDAKEALEGIFENNKRLILLVNDLLDVSRINMGKSKEESASVDACKMLQEAIVALNGLAQERSVVISYKELCTSIPNVKMGPKHLFQSFENLLSNAIKYTPDKGAIKTTVDFRKKSVFISIADNGIGIPKEDQPKIFSKFFRASNAALKETEGSGLGLNVVKSFIEDFGGKVSFASKEGKGTTFTIELPADTKQ